MYEIVRQANFVFLGLLIVSGLLLIYRLVYHIYGYFPAKVFPEARKNHKYAIVIPARYESRVIEELLISIKSQEYPANLLQTFVIVESLEDPTCNICGRYDDVEVFVRPNLEIKTKGGALKQFFSMISEQDNDFDAYFIFDADNVLSPTYISELNKSFDCGYQLGLGFRNSKNWNSSWVAAGCAALFIGMNTYQNKCRSRFFETALMTGTGFYIADEIIRKMGGWTFETLTEDVELSFFVALHRIKVAYHETAEFFDEQPCSFTTSWKQRIRWLRGYHQNKQLRKKALKSALRERNFGGIEVTLAYLPILFPVVSIALYITFMIVIGVIAWWSGLGGYDLAFGGALVVFGGVYFFLVLYFLAIMWGNRRRVGLKYNNGLIAACMYPVFLSQFVSSYFIYFFKKDVKWEAIERTTNIKVQINEDYDRRS